MTSNPASVGPAPDGERPSSDFYRVGEFIGNRPVLCEHGSIDPNNLCPYCEGDQVYPGRLHPDREAEPTGGAVVELIAWLERQASNNDDYASDLDEDADEWAANPDSFKASRADNCRRNAEACRTEATRFRRWVSALSVSPPVVEGSSLRDWRPTHRHIKRGTEYVVVATGTLQLPDSLFDEDPVTIYQERDGRWWVRDTASFNDGRFETLAAPQSEPLPGGVGEWEKVADLVAAVWAAGFAGTVIDTQKTTDAILAALSGKEQ